MSIDCVGPKRYVVHEGALVPATVVAHAANARWLSNDTERLSFEIELAEPGAYSLCVTPQGPCSSGYLAPHGTLKLEK